MSSINTYKDESICETLTEEYNLKNAVISETKKGGDNTVLLITSNTREYLPHIFRILETKSIEDIRIANDIVQNIPKSFIEQRLIFTSSQEICSSVDGKNAALYNYVDSAHIEDFAAGNIKKLAEFMRSFHSLSDKYLSTTTELLKKEVGLLKLYFSKEVREQGDPKINVFYEEFFQYLEIISNKLSSGRLTKGVSHNDFSPDNLLWDKASEGYNLIDWDCISLDDFQIMDFIHFIVKSRIILNERLLRVFMEEYQLDIPLETLYAWSLVFSVRSLLSTDYYTYTVKKISPSWVKKNGQEIQSTLLSVSSYLLTLIAHEKQSKEK